MWAGRGRVDSTQASAREIGVQACWRSCTSFAKKNQIYKKKFFQIFLVFLSSGISQPGLLRLHLSLPGVSFAHFQVYRPSFVPLRSLSVASRLSLVSRHPDPCRLPADSLWIRPRFCALLDHCQLPADMFFLVSCHPGHCRLPADLLWFRPRYCAIQTTDQPTLLNPPNVLRWGLNPCLYRNLVRNQRVSNH